MKTKIPKFRQGVVSLLALSMTFLSLPFNAPALASSHMDAPLITLDPSANTTDVYAFVTEENSQRYLNVALSVYPHQEPGVGPNKYNFDDNVRYEIHLALGSDLTIGRPTLTYRFEFDTRYKNTKTILQSYLGVVQNVDDANQNLTQTYSVTKLARTGPQFIGTGVVPPNNQGIATPFYNQGDNGENPARQGVSTEAALDRYTRAGLSKFSNGYVAFAGQRDDGFYADVQSIFDLLQLRNPGKDSQGGFNVHMMALRIPMSDIGGDQQIAGVFATTSREIVPVTRDQGLDINDLQRECGNYSSRQKQTECILNAINRNKRWTQVARQGNPLFNEGLVAIEDKDLYSRTLPTEDQRLFRKYAENPELASLINLIIGKGATLAIDKNRTDIAGIYIPDVIKVDLSTPAVKLAGNGAGAASNPDDTGFSRLSIFGGDVLKSKIQDPFKNGGFIPGGWPNGRRFGDDVVDIAIIALLSDLRDPNNLKISDPFMGNYDGVTKNDIGYNKVFPYEPTPQNGRNHTHP